MRLDTILVSYGMVWQRCGNYFVLRFCHLNMMEYFHRLLIVRYPKAENITPNTKQPSKNAGPMVANEEDRKSVV